jgi:hypothetical protein
MLNGVFASFDLPQQGQQYVSIATSQSLSTPFTVATGSQYLLHWFDGIGNESPQPASATYAVSILSASSQVVTNSTFDAAHAQDWVERSLNVNLVPGNYTLTYARSGAEPGGFSGNIDNVSLSTVPEPSSLALMFVGVIVVAGRRVKRMKCSL